MRFLEFLAVSALASASAFAEPSAATRFRGVMLAGNVDAIQEDDFATLETWGANLVRFQTPRGWSKPRYWESNDDYDAYIGHALDILQDWSYHAFREWDGWSVEKTWTGRENGRDIFVPDGDTPRKRALLYGFARSSRP